MLSFLLTLFTLPNTLGGVMVFTNEPCPYAPSLLTIYSLAPPPNPSPILACYTIITDDIHILDTQGDIHTIPLPSTILPSKEI